MKFFLFGQTTFFHGKKFSDLRKNFVEALKYIVPQSICVEQAFFSFCLDSFVKYSFSQQYVTRSC